VQLVNCSNEIVLGTAGPAHKKGLPGVTILPREGTWVMQPAHSGNNLNVLTFDIPLEWENTQCQPHETDCLGPRFWPRTGCRYDEAFDWAQCETGDCSNRYDCSAARLFGLGPATLSEWTFAQPVSNGQVSYLKDSPDISAVDGVNLNIDIQQIGGDATNPTDDLKNKVHDAQWLAENYPLTMHGADLRTNGNCVLKSVSGIVFNQANFLLTRSKVAAARGGVIVIDDKNTPRGGDATVGCFSNCGRYEFPSPPDKSCDETMDAHCFRWKAFCLGDPSKYYPSFPTNCTNPPCHCSSDSDCVLGASCWDQKSNAPTDLTCQGRAFIRNPPCEGDVCTFPYGYTDPVTGIASFAYQPPFGNCSLVDSAIAPYDPSVCIGDDTIHQVMRKAYTWPNDPQVYDGDAPAYRVIFAPGGTDYRPLTPIKSSIPSCDSLPAVYNYSTARTNCDVPIHYGAIFGVAVTPAQGNGSWACDQDPSGAANGVLCRWPEPNPEPEIEQVGYRVNFHQGGQDLQLNIPKVLRGIGNLLLASITFDSAATPTPPSGWSPVPNADVTSSTERTVLWYHFVSKGDQSSYTWTWNQPASPSGGISVWRGVDSTTPFDVAATTASGESATATAPVITTVSPDTRLLSVFGANATQPSFGAFGILQSNGQYQGNETFALKLNVQGGGTYYAHFVADRTNDAVGPMAAQSAAIVQPASPPAPPPVTPDWTAITVALRAEK